MNRAASDGTEVVGSDNSVCGASPSGASDRESAARAVREMFTAIAPRYDLLNHLLSANVDKLWWRRTARSFADILARPDAQVLDLCCGTGDMALALRKQSRQAEITGADFSHTMLVLASKKKSAGHPIRWIEADALQLPFPDQSFDLVTSAFGFRNLADYDAGLREILRVLRPGGECGILEFSEPQGIMGKIYDVYFKCILPQIGRLISGNNGAYSYLPASVERFPTPREILARMTALGFADPSWAQYTFGIAGLFRGKR
ncbi:MAG TPA: bifunctional demethylmenaquinone methyltransferase/2-methoxy-6-polyprenyl-1,4-benzoquinol methylase UbiE [Terriglobales bacterium]|nr:bifunctional demethylmenaquinone methyltransferase/2-methoxy-6-polyprenyl-1,4-benzoquinol methylase UbiE [Terriglobales bacterium]